MAKKLAAVLALALIGTGPGAFANEKADEVDEARRLGRGGARGGGGLGGGGGFRGGGGGGGWGGQGKGFARCRS
jgi:hypothetical protein